MSEYRMPLWARLLYGPIVVYAAVAGVVVAGVLVVVGAPGWVVLSALGGVALWAVVALIAHRTRGF